MNKRIRRVVFGSRSALPTSAGCVVANGIRETLASLLELPVEVRLSEPAIPSAAAWPDIIRDALVYRVTGTVADAAIVLRSNDALILTSALFGEPAHASGARELSPIENDVLDRTVRAMASHLGALCGVRDVHTVEGIDSITRFSTYFEIFVESPLIARIGVALSREPHPAPQQHFELAHLANIPLMVRATMEVGALRGVEAAALRPGALVSLGRASTQRCALRAVDRVLMRGSCGVRSSHYAITVTAL